MPNRDLLSLPTEILRLIVRHHLRAFEVERLARTFNKLLVSICVPELGERESILRNARRMVALFGPTASDTYAEFRTMYTAAGLEAEWGTFEVPDLSPARGFTLFDPLDLTSRLESLPSPHEPLQHMVLRESPILPGQAPPRRGRWVSEHMEDTVVDREPALTRIRAEACALGLHLTPTYFHYMSTRPLRTPEQSSIPFEIKSFVRIVEWASPTEHPAPRRYVLPLDQWDEFDREYWYLYPDTQGGQCVLLCYYPFEAESPDGGPADRLGDAEDGQTETELQLGVETVRAEIEDLELVASSVEEYFAWNYIGSWQHKWWQIRDKGQAMPAPLKEFLVKAFSARGRALA